jgi:hypothetical protein
MVAYTLYPVVESSAELGLGAFVMAFSLVFTVGCFLLCIATDNVLGKIQVIDGEILQELKKALPNHDGFINKLLAMDRAKRALQDIDDFLAGENKLDVSLEDIIDLKKDRVYWERKMQKYVRKMKGHRFQHILQSIRGAEKWGVDVAEEA